MIAEGLRASGRQEAVTLPEDKSERLSRRLLSRMDDIMWAMTRANIGEYVEMFRRPRRFLWLNFLAGIARGLGTVVGFSLLGALLIYILTLQFVRNLPVIGGFIAELITIINQHMGVR